MHQQSGLMDDLFKEKIVAIHQPNYFPWLGYFFKIAASDVFVFHDNVEHSKRYPTRRTMIRKSAHDTTPIWLTVPLKKHSDFVLIKDLEVVSNIEWRGKHLRTLKNAYSKAPFFDEIFPIITNCFDGMEAFSHLADLNIFVIDTISGLMEIKRPFLRSSAMPISEKAATLNIEIVKHLKGTTYLSGTGAKNYQSVPIFNESGIILKYSQFSTLINSKEWGIPNSLSVLDALFYLGIPETKNLLNSCPIV
jgi:hypothetical protein